jgi:2-dehydropantoate 2-reductase
LGVKNGDLLKSPAALQVMQMAAQEVEGVAGSCGVKLEYEDISRAVAEVAAATADNLSSMLQDIRRGAPTEIEALCGAVVRKGEQVGVATPVNELLLDLIQARVELNNEVIDDCC